VSARRYPFARSTYCEVSRRKQVANKGQNKCRSGELMHSFELACSTDNFLIHARLIDIREAAW